MIRFRIFFTFLKTSSSNKPVPNNRVPATIKSDIVQLTSLENCIAIIGMIRIIVTKSKRGLKIGSALYSKVIEYGYKKGVKRIEWAVLDWNKPAIEFYEKTGAKVLRDWDTVHIENEAIKNYIETL